MTRLASSRTVEDTIARHMQTAIHTNIRLTHGQSSGPGHASRRQAGRTCRRLMVGTENWFSLWLAPARRLRLYRRPPRRASFRLELRAPGSRAPGSRAPLGLALVLGIKQVHPALKGGKMRLGDGQRLRIRVREAGGRERLSEGGDNGSLEINLISQLLELDGRGGTVIHCSGKVHGAVRAAPGRRRTTKEPQSGQKCTLPGTSRA